MVTLSQIHAENATMLKLCARIEELEAALVDIRELVDGYEDVDDGQPNLAMRVLTIAEAATAPRREENNDVFPGFRGNNDNA